MKTTISEMDIRPTLELIAAVKNRAKAEGLPAPPLEMVLEKAIDLLKYRRLIVDELADELVQAWRENIAAVQSQVLNAAEDIATVRLAAHQAAYHGDEMTKAEIEAFAEELVKRNSEALKGLAKL